MELEIFNHLKDAFSAVTKDGAWAAFCLILLVALILESRANRKVTQQSTEAFIALRTVIETWFAVSTTTTKKPRTPRKRTPK